MALHEAGHAVVSILWGRQVEYVTIAPQGELFSECNNGELLFSLEDSQEVNGQRLFREGVILSAGMAAENLILGIQPEESRALEDMKKFERLLGRMSEQQKDAMHDSVCRMAFSTIGSPMTQRHIKAVAEELIKVKTLSEEQIKNVMETASW
jgi:ATP-dependent Zn protease